MSQLPAGHQYSAPKPLPLWTVINVIIILLLIGLIAWTATLQRRNKDLEKKVAAIQKTAQAAATASGQPRKGQAVAPAAAPVARARKRRRPTTTTTAPATQPTAAKSPATQPARLVTDQELARIEQLHTVAIRRHEQGTATPLDILRARRLLNRAKLLHGDLTREQYQQESDKLFAEAAAKLTALEQAGLAEPGTILEFYETMLSERR